MIHLYSFIITLAIFSIGFAWGYGVRGHRDQDILNDRWNKRGDRE